MSSVLWDEEVGGLGVRRNKRGATWVLKYRADGKQIIVSLGPEELISRVQAQALATKMKWEGNAPVRKPRYRRTTVKEFCEVYLARHAKPRKSSWKKDVERTNEYILPGIGGQSLSAVSRADVARLHSDITSRPAPTAANRVVEQIQKMFSLAVEWGYLPEQFENPAKHIERNPEASRTRWLTTAEIARLAPVLASLPAAERIFYWLLLLTGCRYSEILNLRWSDVDLQEGFIHIAMTKNGRPHMVPLSSPAVNLLRELPQSSPLVFAGRKRMDKVWRKVRAQVGLDDVRIHDLRHTTASHLIQKGYPLKVVADLLNHQTLATTMRYAHLAKHHISAALEDYAGSIMPSMG